MGNFNPKLPTKHVGTNKYITFFVSRNRSPTGADYRQPETGTLYSVGTVWQVGKDPTTGSEGDLWMLSKIVANIAYWVQLSTGGTPTDEYTVQQATAPGVNPVTADGTGNVTINGAVVANHGVPIESHTRNLYEYNLEIQYAGSAAATDGTLSGVAHFDTAFFDVDADGFVSSDGTKIAQTITGQTGGALSPTAGNWNIYGIGDTSTSGSGSTLSIFSPNLNSIIVDADADYGTYTTVAAAIAGASSGDLIFIRPGTYTEDITVDKGLTFVAFNRGSEDAGPVIISGKVTIGVTTAKFIGLTLASNGDNVIESTSAGGQINLDGCRMNIETGVFGFNITNASGPSIRVRNTRIAGSGSAKFINYASSAGAAFIEYSIIDGCSAATSTIDAGSVTLRFCIANVIFTTASAGRLAANFTQFGPQVTPYLDVTYLTTVGTGTSQLFNCNLFSGTAAAVSIGSGTTVQMVHCSVNSSAANILTGAGTLLYGNLVYTGSSTTTNVTTETGYTTV